jgi:hypothetical protein
MLDRLLPVWAVFLDDIRQTVRHWAFLTWGMLGLAAALIWFVSPQPTSGSPPTPQAAAVTGEASEPSLETSSAARRPTAADFGGRILGAHVLVWAVFVIALGASAIAAEAEIAPEAILCRGVSRWQYYLAKCASRVAMVSLLFAGLTVAPLGLAALRLTNDLNLSASLHTLGIGLLYLSALTVIGVAASSWFTNPLISVVVCWMGLYGMGIVVAVLELTGLSPLGLSAQLPMLLRGETTALDGRHLLSVLVTGAFASTLLSLSYFSFRDA